MATYIVFGVFKQWRDITYWANSIRKFKCRALTNVLHTIKGAGLNCSKIYQKVIKLRPQLLIPNFVLCVFVSKNVKFLSFEFFESQNWTKVMKKWAILNVDYVLTIKLRKLIQ